MGNAPNHNLRAGGLPDVLLGVGGMVGTYPGAVDSRYVPANIIEWMLVGTILFTGGQYAAGFFGL